MNDLGRIRISLLILSVVFYIVSLTQKTYCVDNDSGEYGTGLLNLGLGWIGIAFLGAFISGLLIHS